MPGLPGLGQRRGATATLGSASGNRLATGRGGPATPISRPTGGTAACPPISAPGQRAPGQRIPDHGATSRGTAPGTRCLSPGPASRESGAPSGERAFGAAGHRGTRTRAAPATRCPSGGPASRKPGAASGERATGALPGVRGPTTGQGGTGRGAAPGTRCPFGGATCREPGAAGQDTGRCGLLGTRCRTTGAASQESGTTGECPRGAPGQGAIRRRTASSARRLTGCAAA